MPLLYASHLPPHLQQSMRQLGGFQTVPDPSRGCKREPGKYLAASAAAVKRNRNATFFFFLFLFAASRRNATLISFVFCATKNREIQTYIAKKKNAVALSGVVRPLPRWPSRA